MNQKKIITLFQVIIIVLLLFFIPFLLQEAKEIRETTNSSSYGYEILPQLLAFIIGFMLIPHKTKKLLTNRISVNWLTLIIGGTIFLLAWIPFIYLVDFMAFILPTAFVNHYSEIKFIILLLGGYVFLKGLVAEKKVE